MVNWTLIIWAIAQTGSAVQPPPAASVVYFPPSFAKPSVPCTPDPRHGLIPIVSDFEAKWYSGQLSAAQEPSLYEAAQGNRQSIGSTVRFTWLRTFHSPVMVRVEGLGSTSPRLIAKQLSGAGGYAPGLVNKRIERNLSPAEANALKAVLSSTRVFESVPAECGLGTDGAQWIVESVDGTGYHFVNRWTPERGGVRELGMAMLKLTDWQFEDIY